MDGKSNQDIDPFPLVRGPQLDSMPNTLCFKLIYLEMQAW